jgi:predicted phosphodiesterase
LVQAPVVGEKMKLAIISDLHLEFNRDLVLKFDEDTDRVIVAGDVSPNLTSVEKFLKDIPHRVIFVAGNHDYYHNNYQHRIDQFRETFKNSNVVFLEKDTLLEGDYLIFGATLWSEYLTPNQKTMITDEGRREAMRNINMQEAFDCMNDFRLIYTEYGLATPSYFLKEFEETMDKLESFLHYENKKRIIVTHNAPTYRTTNPIFQNSKLNPAFHNHLDDIIEQHEIDLWVHGHSHFDADLWHSNTRIVSSQVGYPREKSYEIRYVEV